jgi:phage-related minor tail protein
LDASTATGLLVQGMQAGARNSDLVADAIKEFSIRAVDGSKTTSDGFKAIGVDAGQMAAQIARGGPEASAALDLVLNRFRAMPDPVAQSRAAVALFGTQAEDLGKAL